jgi:hypothetical protein
MLGEVPLSDVGVVLLELFEEFGHGWEAAIGFTDTWDSIDNKLAEPVVADQVEEACWEFVEEGTFVVLDEITARFLCECKDEIRGEAYAPPTHH